MSFTGVGAIHLILNRFNGLRSKLTVYNNPILTPTSFTLTFLIRDGTYDIEFTAPFDIF